MARYTGPVCKICRREGEKLFLKGERCLSNKCSFEKRGFAPGQHGKTKRFKISEYGIQLREKQKLKNMYHLLENQFRNTFKRAEREKGITGDNLLRILESRFDNVVFRLGFAPSRKTARQLIRHRHFMINDRVVDIPSYRLKKGDVVKVKDQSKKLETIHRSLRKTRDVNVSPWLSLDKAKLSGVFLEVPNREDIPVDVNENLIIELYSK